MTAPPRPTFAEVMSAPDPGMSVLGVLSGAMVATMLDLGHQTGLTAALAAGPADVDELARRSDGDPRITREWLRCLRAAGLVVGSDDGPSAWSPDAAELLAAPPGSPMDLSPGVELFSVLASCVPAVAAAFRVGCGLPHAEYPAGLPEAMARMSAGWTGAVLPDLWVRSVPFLTAALDAGGRIAEVGCGAGTALEALCGRFPTASATGFDLDERAVEGGRVRLAERGLGQRVELRACDAVDGLSGPYDLVLALSVLHDCVDLDEMLQAIAKSLSPDGCLLVVESPPLVGAFAAMLLATSTLYCVPATAARGASEPLGTLGLSPGELAAAAARAGLVLGAPLPQVVPSVAATVFHPAV
jgi:SAM-dependent methyltransferase